jgi:hypothetical protein
MILLMSYLVILLGGVYMSLLQHQSSEITESLKLMDTGKAVMKKLGAALYEVLLQMEQKEKVLQNAWGEIRDSAETKPGSIRNSSYGFEPELSGKKNVIAGTMFDGISTLAAEGKCEEWCSTVIGICERLVSFMSRETHLQQWATVLEREGTRLAMMEEEMEKAKKATLEQQAAAEAMMKSADEKSSSLEEERIKIVQERENLILWVSHLQERRKVKTALMTHLQVELMQEKTDLPLHPSAETDHFLCMNSKEIGTLD